MRLSTLLLLTCLAAFAGCSQFVIKPPITPDAGKGDSGTPFDAGVRSDAGLPLAEACTALNLNRCAYFIRCGLVEDSMAGRDACVRELEATWCGPLTWPPHVIAGGLKFDPVKAETCATAFATWSCAEYASLPPSCESIVKPRQALGEPCYDGFTECTEGVCKGATCPRTCQARGLAQAPCTTDGDCRTGLFCRVSPFNPVNGECAAFGSTGAPCQADRECLIGLHCVEQFCRVLPNAGEPCLNGACTDSAYCDATRVDGGTCLARKGETAPCDGDQCQSVLECDPIDHLCLRDEVNSGDPCSAAQTCPTGETCLHDDAQTKGTCGAPGDVGATCISHDDCLAHLACLGGDGGLSCQPRRVSGSACTDARECFDTAVCANGKCVERGLPMQECSSDVPCRWGLCHDDGDGGVGVCGSLLGAGLSCSSGAECASGLCDNGTCIGRCLP